MAVVDKAGQGQSGIRQSRVELTLQPVCVRSKKAQEVAQLLNILYVDVHDLVLASLVVLE